MKKFLLVVLVIGAIAYGAYMQAPKPSPGSVRYPEAVAIIFPGHAHSYGVSPYGEEIQSIIAPTSEHGGYLSVVSAEGKPIEIGVSRIIPAPTNKDANAMATRLSDPNGEFAAIYAIATWKSTTEEVDCLAAINFAAAKLHSMDADACDKKTLNIFNPGLSTTGEYIDFTKGIINADYDALVEKMVADTTAKIAGDGTGRAEALPDLTGIHVVWYGLGRMTAYPQDDVPSSDVARMKELWTKILTAAGAESINFRDYMPQGLPNTVEDGYAYVTPIPFAPTEVGGWVISKPVPLTENVLGFNPEQATYRNGEDGASGEELAQQVLKPYAEALRNSGQTIIVLGCAWNDGTGDEVELAGHRAQRVRDDLVAFGVSSEQLVVVSAGNLGTNVHIGGGEYNLYKADQPEWSRAVWFIPVEQGDEVLARFSIC
jgi:hypothetical protein